MRAQFIRFLVAGGAAALVNWGSRFGFSRYLPYEAAVMGSFVLGLTTGFLLMRGWVFNAKQHPVKKQVATYVLVNLLALLQTLAISSLLARWLLPPLGIERFAEALAHAAGIVVPVFTSFVFHRKATFRAAPSVGQPAELERALVSQTSFAQLLGEAPSSEVCSDDKGA